MRIVFISTMWGTPWGGSEELWSQAAIQLVKAGHSVAASVVSWQTPSPKMLALSKHGVKIFPRKPLRRKLVRQLWHRLTHLSEEFEGGDWLISQSPSLVVISQGGNVDGLKWMEFCRDSGIPYVVVVQCNYEHFWPSDDCGLKMAAAYGGARRVFCVSHHNLRLLEWQIARDLPNGMVVFNPLNIPLETNPSPWPAESGVWKLASVARLEPAYKGQDVLFRVLALPCWRERPVEVNLYGTGPCERGLRHLAEKLRLSNVNFRGHVSDVSAIWKQNHLLVLPSRCEGMPLALLEAFWCGRPAVVTDVGGNAEICRDGETSFVASAPAVGPFADALERAWKRRNEWPGIGHAARKFIMHAVPADPVEEFCRKLMACLSTEGKPND